MKSQHEMRINLKVIALTAVGVLQSCSSSKDTNDGSLIQDPYLGSYWTITDVYLDNSNSPEISAHTEISPEADWLLRFNPPTGNYGKTFEIAYYCGWYYSEYGYNSSLISFIGARVWDEGDCIPDDAPPVDYPQVRTFLAHMLNEGDEYTVETMGEDRISILSPSGEGVSAIRSDPFERTWVQ